MRSCRGLRARRLLVSAQASACGSRDDRRSGRNNRKSAEASWRSHTMKVCWIKAGGFVPCDYGGRIRSYQMVKELARRHSVTVVTFYPAMENDEHSTIAPLF